MDRSFTKGKPVFIFIPISTPLNNIGVPQFSKTILEDAASILTLNSFPAGKLPAIQTNCFTFFFTNSLPVSFEYLSGDDCNKSARLVRNPTVIIVTDLSGCDANAFLYTSVALNTSSFFFILCVY